MALREKRHPVFVTYDADDYAKLHAIGVEEGIGDAAVCRRATLRDIKRIEDSKRRQSEAIGANREQIAEIIRGGAGVAR